MARPRPSRLAEILALAAIVAAALWLRTHGLGDRPMHADEANQAVKLGRALETGRYVFDPQDHHGPTLYALGLIPAWLGGARTLAGLTESLVRLTPALFGTASVLLLYLLARDLGRRAAWLAAALLAVSPAAVYYSRDFIQETLLAAFALGTVVCARRAAHTGGAAWAAATGLCAGLMQATKATAPLLLGAGLLAWLWVERDPEQRPPSRWRPAQGLVAFAAAVGAAGLLYSWFFTHPRGWLDAIATYAPSLHRGLGGASGQEKPWSYYGSLFLFHRAGGVIWDQSLFLALAAAGAGLACSGRRAPRLVRWVALATGLAAAALSAIPYKTPWMVINLLPGLALLAAWAVSRLSAWAAVPLAGAVLALLLGQTRQAVFRFPASPRNPLAYVQAAPDLLRVPALAAAAPPGPIKVISSEYWPLPWYLRSRPEVGYWTEPPADCDGSLVLAGADQAGAVRSRLRGAYRETYLGLRPNFVLVVFTPVR